MPGLSHLHYTSPASPSSPPRRAARPARPPPRARPRSGLSLANELSNFHTVLPLAFALLPAAAGLLLTNGAALISDILLLGLSSIFLHWLTTFPWECYTQSKCAEPSPELREHNRLALLSCYVAPLLGAWLLHTIRPLLATPAGVLTDLNLAIYVLAALLRPAAETVKLVRAKNRELHKCTAEPEGRVEEVAREVAELREVLERLRSGEVEALMRAVRRYERNERVNVGVLEAKIEGVEKRLEGRGIVGWAMSVVGGEWIGGWNGGRGLEERRRRGKTW